MEKLIELSKITKKYGKKTILKDINLTVEKGGMLAILGESGSGKSTLLNIIGLLENWNKGSVRIGKNIFKNIDIPKRTQVLRKEISYLFQNFALVDTETVDYNLNIALTYLSNNKKERKLIKENALNEMSLSPDFLEKKIYTLSGGEQQRVALARVLIKPSQIILADEPTGSLDKINAQLVLDHLKRLQGKGKTIIVVTHDEMVAEACDNTIVLKSNF